jgi:hypothetical protein
VDHRVAAPGKPVDVRHMMEFHCNDGFIEQAEAFRQMPL